LRIYHTLEKFSIPMDISERFVVVHLVCEKMTHNVLKSVIAEMFLIKELANRDGKKVVVHCPSEVVERLFELIGFSYHGLASFTDGIEREIWELK